MRQHAAIKAVAVFEASKGLVALFAASGLLLLVHKDVYELAMQLVAFTHLNPAAKYPSIFLDAAANVGDSRLMMLALGAAAYSIFRIVEAYGLYFERAWAEVLAAFSGAIYVPLEVAELVRRPGALSVAVLCLNIAVVAVMVHALLMRRKASMTRPSGAGQEHAPQSRTRS